jgi:hypothetical protein
MTTHQEQSTRQAELEARYEADGRGDRSHPHHATYTGLVAGFNTTEQESTDDND